MRLPPSDSGKEVVGAAMIPPVGWKVSSFKVISERTTASRLPSAGPSQWQRLAHSCHQEIVLSMLSTRSGTKRGVRCER
ncbi:hypothetical protein D3C87_1546210 [compost metagenome]